MTISSKVVPEQQGLLGFVRRRPLFSYFFLAFALSWLFWLPLGFAQDGLGVLPFRLPVTLMIGGAVGPIGSAFLVTAITLGASGVRRLLRRMVQWRVGIRWYGFALLGAPLLLSLGMLVVAPGAWAAVRMDTLPSALLIYTVFFVSQLFTSGLFEEPGWRGFALPRLQERYGALKGTLILAACHGCWHFPLFLFQNSGSHGGGTGFFDIAVPFATFLVSATMLTIVFSWVFNHTNGSVLIAMMMHAALNSAPRLLPSETDISEYRSLAGMIVFGALALVILAVTRGKLGYTAPQVGQPHAVT